MTFYWLLVSGCALSAWLTGYGTAQRVRRLLEQERWIVTGFMPMCG